MLQNISQVNFQTEQEDLKKSQLAWHDFVHKQVVQGTGCIWNLQEKDIQRNTVKQ